MSSKTIKSLKLCSDDQLKYYYLVKRYSTSKIARLTTLSQSYVQKRLNKLKVKMRLNEHKTNCKNNMRHGYYSIINTYKKQNPYCENCEWQETICDLHHIIPLSKGGTNDHLNLITLCPNCHRLVHRGIILLSELQEIKNRMEM